MTTNERLGNKLPTSYSLEVSDMAMIACTGYGRDGKKCSCRFSVSNNDEDSGIDNIMRGTVICPTCGAGTGFEMDDNGTITYVSGLSAFGALGAKVPSASKTLYAQAEACLLSAAPDAAAAMCRGSAEIALNLRGLPSVDSLFKKINDAKNLKANPLTDEEIMLAHGCRLITRESIHHGDLVNLNIIPSMLTATVQILNTLYP